MVRIREAKKIMGMVRIREAKKFMEMVTIWFLEQDDDMLLLLNFLMHYCVQWPYWWDGIE
jgi:hypothetical protein